MTDPMYRFPACRLGLSGVFCVLCVLEVGRASLIDVAHSGGPFPSRHSNAEIRQSLALYWMDKGSVCPRREPATDRFPRRTSTMIRMIRCSLSFHICPRGSFRIRIRDTWTPITAPPQL